MKPIELAEGITMAVPPNFPHPMEWEDGTDKAISYSLRPHEGAPRFLHFFEIRFSREELDADRILANLGYEIGAKQEEEITVGGRNDDRAYEW